jgi:formamidopyrimidine-DNA glycosylase
MPELPEVETIVRHLDTLMTGQYIESVDVLSAGLRFPFPAHLAHALQGCRVSALGRRAKYGLVHLEGGSALIFHLGMSGRWRVNAEEPQRHDHLRLKMSHSGWLALNDPRRFGMVDLAITAELAQHRFLAMLGPEPLSEDVHADYLYEKSRLKNTPLKAFLLDQHIIAGLGNIYVCEALHTSQLHPVRAARLISFEECVTLVKNIKTTLLEAIAAGGSTLKDFKAPDGSLGYFAHQWRVYNKAHQACACGGEIIRITQSGRSTYLCPDCQSWLDSSPIFL